MTPPNTSRLTDQEIEALVRMEKVSAGDFVTVTGAGLNPSEAYTYAKEILKRGGALLAEIVRLRRALRFYAEAPQVSDSWQACGEICADNGDTARAALAELERIEK